MTLTSQQNFATLSNGVQMPQVGFGCAFGNWTGATKFQGFLPDKAWRAVTLAVQSGFRAFDMAYAYGTHRQVGDILGRNFADGTLTREELFLTTKVAHPLAPPHIGISHQRTWNARDVASVRQRVLDDYDNSLQEVGVGQFDLLLLHWPGAFGETDAAYAREARKEMWGALETILEQGTARAIGVCNFTQQHLEELFEDCTVRPMVNQIEIHPYCQQPELVKFCEDNQILVEAYAPFASGAHNVLKDPVLLDIASRNERSIGQVILRWQVQQGHCVVPKSSSLARMAENQAVFDFELSAEDMAAIAALGEPNVAARRTCPDPASIV